MSAEDDRTKESATVLARVGAFLFPTVSLSPWGSNYDKKTEAAIVGIKTTADVSEELERQVWMASHPKSEAEEPKNEEEIFDTSKLHGAAYIFGFGLNRLAMNMHNYAPSINGIRPAQAISLAKANNPGIMTQPGEGGQKRSLFEKMTGRGKEKDKQ